MQAQSSLRERETTAGWVPSETDLRKPTSSDINRVQSGIPHLLDPDDSWEQVSRRIRAATNLWIFLDFDGTLVRYYDRPEDVKLSSRCRRILARLARHRRVHLAIVSGRRNAVLRKYFQMPGVKFLGLFGWEKSGRRPLPNRIKLAMRALRRVLAPLPTLFPGIIVEDKEISHAVHFRGMPVATQRRVRASVRKLVSRFRSDLSVIQSQHACEIVPRQVKGKGVAMREFTRSLRAPFLPIYVGDDLTDEPAFAALREGITVRVGDVPRTKARFRLANPEEVCTFLERIEEELS